MFHVQHIKVYEYLYDKTVAIIGGKDGYDEKLVNTADVVVRINQHFLRQGGRCNALYVATCDPVQFKWEECMPMYMAYRISGIYAQDYRDYCERYKIHTVPFQNERYGKSNPLGVDYEWTNILGHQIGAKPFTGTLAIAHLCSFPIRSLYITGMDFHTGAESKIPRIEGEQPTYMHEKVEGGYILKRGPHDIKPQVLWLRDYIKCDKRIAVDKTLANVLKEANTWRCD